MPIAAVIRLDANMIAEGRNAIWYPSLSLHRHAETEALRQVPARLMERSRDMTLYTTLEACLICTGAILLHRIGRALYGSADAYGGRSAVFGHMSVYREERLCKTEWLGPAHPKKCDDLFARAAAMEATRREGRLS